jgi:hypothetical protein
MAGWHNCRLPARFATPPLSGLVLPLVFVRLTLSELSPSFPAYPMYLMSWVEWSAARVAFLE